MNKYYKYILQELESVKDKKIMFWGASIFLKEFLKKHPTFNYNIFGIVDKNPERWGDIFEGYKIFSPKILTENDEIYVIYTIYSDFEKSRKSVERDIEILKTFNDKLSLVPITYVQDINDNRAKCLASNKIYLVDSKGQKHLANYIKGLQVNWLSENAVIEIGANPLPRFKDCIITIDKNSKFSIGSSIHPIRNLKINLLEKNTSLNIGENFSAGQVNFIIRSPNVSITIGNDCMFSRQIVMRCDDSHTIFDDKTKHIINDGKDIKIGNHVWVGAGISILKGTTIKDNSIVGTKSVVTKSFEESNIIIAGNPAKIVKRNVNWDRKQIYTFRKDLCNYGIEV